MTVGFVFDIWIIILTDCGYEYFAAYESIVFFVIDIERPGILKQSKKSSLVVSATKVTLRTKIFFITILIILLIQTLNSMLQIGFLSKNLEKNNVHKYVLIGTEIKRKLEKSLLFGKPLGQLNFKRLLEGILPEDIQNFFIINAADKTLFAVRQTALPPHEFLENINTQKTENFYQITIPLVKQSKTVGNMITMVSVAHVRKELFLLINDSIKNSLIIMAVVLPFLYLVLSLWINRPYTRSIKRLTRSLLNRDRDSLLSAGINLDTLLEAEKQVNYIGSGKWLAMENSEVFTELKLFSKVIAALVNANRTGQSYKVALKTVLSKKDLEFHAAEIEQLVSNHYIYEQMIAEWKTMLSDVKMNRRSKSL